jgi:hypothetical protein
MRGAVGIKKNLSLSIYWHSRPRSAAERLTGRRAGLRSLALLWGEC